MGEKYNVFYTIGVAIAIVMLVLSVPKEGALFLIIETVGACLLGFCGAHILFTKLYKL